MPTINLTSNAQVIVSADNAPLKRYLKSILTFEARPRFDEIQGLLVKDQDAHDFPLDFSATGQDSLPVGKTTLELQGGGAASIDLMKGDDQADFCSALNLPADIASSGLVSFQLKGSVSAADTAKQSDFTFGVTAGASFAVTSYYAAKAGEPLVDAVKTAVESLTIPHDVADLESMAAGAICRVKGAGSLKFSASFTYSFLNDPLATVPLGSLPPFAIRDYGSATLEGSVTHSADHTLTIARLASGLIHLAVSLTNTDDFETSLTVSAGATAEIDGKDALEFLLGKISPDCDGQAAAIAAEMPDAAKFRGDIKSAMDTALSSAFAVSLKGALENCTVKNRAFLYEIELGKLDDVSRAALAAALTGDFTGLTRAGGQLSGIKELDSVLTVNATHTHTFALHLLGIFNAASIHTFVAKSKIGITADTKEIVLSDKSVDVVVNNLDAEKLRKVLVKAITLTLPASANTKDSKAPVTIAFFDREGSASRQKLVQFANALSYVGAPGAASARALLTGKQDDFGVCLMSLGLSLDTAHCQKLFMGTTGPNDRHVYMAVFCKAMRAILAGDTASASRVLLFNQNQATWEALYQAGSTDQVLQMLQGMGMSEEEAMVASVDVTTGVWWAKAMADYSEALAKGQSVESAGKQVVQDSDMGFGEPWMVLAAWELSGRPAVQAQFVTALTAQAATA